MAKELINKLHQKSLLYLAPSKVHGIGLFALRKIYKDEKLYADQMPEVYHISYGQFKKIKEPLRTMILGQWPQIVNDSAFVWPTTRMVAYCNHSEDPNFDAFRDMALKNIEEGEEVFEDYKMIPNWEMAFPWLVEK